MFFRGGSRYSTRWICLINLIVFSSSQQIANIDSNHDFHSAFCQTDFVGIVEKGLHLPPGYRNDLKGAALSNAVAKIVQFAVTPGMEIPYPAPRRDNETEGPSKDPTGLTNTIIEEVLHPMFSRNNASLSSNPDDERNFTFSSLFSNVFGNAVNVSRESIYSVDTNPADKVVGDGIISSFAQSILVDRVLRSAIDRVTIKGFSANVVSPMENIGKGLCQASAASQNADLYSSNYILLGCPDTRLTCAEGEEMPDKCHSHQKLWPLPMKLASFSDVSRRNGELMKYAKHQYGCGAKIPNLIPGYEPVLSIRLSEPRDPFAEQLPGALLPIAVLSQMREECSFVLSIRGSATAYEWEMDALVLQVDLDVGDGSSEYRAHEGFAKIGLPIVSTVANFLASERAECTSPDVTVTGHSLGAGVAHVVAFGLAAKMPAASVDLAAFASPIAFNEAAARALVQKVNVYNWIAQLDVIPFIPCALKEGFTRCSVMDAQPLSGKDFYVTSPNALLIPYSQLAEENNRFVRSNFGRVSFNVASGRLNLSEFHLAAPVEFWLNHKCSYECLLGRAYCQSEEVNCSCQ